MTIQQTPGSTSRPALPPLTKGVLLVLLAGLVIGGVVGLVVGQRNPVTHSTDAACDLGTKSIMCQPVGDGGKPDHDGWTYKVPADVAWVGSGMEHGGGRPECLPPGSGVSDVVRLSWVEVEADGRSWRQVVSVGC